MSSFWYTDVTRAVAEAELDLVSDTIKAAMVMENSTAPTEEDLQYLGDLTTLDEFDGANYARATLTTKALTKDDPQNKTVWDADDLQFAGNVGAGTRKCIGAVLFKDTGNDATSPLVYYLEAPVPFDPADLPVTWLLDTLGLGELAAKTS